MFIFHVNSTRLLWPLVQNRIFPLSPNRFRRCFVFLFLSHGLYFTAESSGYFSRLRFYHSFVSSRFFSYSHYFPNGRTLPAGIPVRRRHELYTTRKITISKWDLPFLLRSFSCFFFFPVPAGLKNYYNFPYDVWHVRLTSLHLVIHRSVGSRSVSVSEFARPTRWPGFGSV